MTALPTDHPDFRRHIFQCASDDVHWILVEWDDLDSAFDPTLTVALVLWPRTWRQRLKAAVASLRGRQSPIDYVLLDPKRVRELKSVLDQLPGD